MSVRKPHSPRFITLGPADVEALFGMTALEPKYPISRGRFVAKQRVALVGPKGRIDGVPVVGPLGETTSLSLSVGDEDRLGVDQRGVIIVGDKGEIKING